MKLQSKQRNGKKVRYVYDPAKTPLQCLLLSGVLPAQKQQELIEVAHALDPILLFQQLEQLQKAVFRSAVNGAPFVSSTPSAPVRIFSVERCTTGNVPAERSIPERSSGDIFRELQCRSPGRYQSLQIRTLQRGMRKIRAYLLEAVEEQWQAEVINGRSPQSVSSAANSARNS